MVTPVLKPNAGDQKICKKKNLSWLFDVDRKIQPSGSLFGITRHSLKHIQNSLANSVNQTSDVQSSRVITIIFTMVTLISDGISLGTNLFL